MSVTYVATKTGLKRRIKRKGGRFHSPPICFFRPYFAFDLGATLTSICFAFTSLGLGSFISRMPFS